MWLLRKYEQLQVFIPEMQSEADAIFALNNGAVIAGQKNWTDFWSKADVDCDGNTLTVTLAPHTARLLTARF